jgi:hypothetical protein
MLLKMLVGVVGGIMKVLAHVAMLCRCSGNGQAKQKEKQELRRGRRCSGRYIKCAEGLSVSKQAAFLELAGVLDILLMCPASLQG